MEGEVEKSVKRIGLILQQVLTAGILSGLTIASFSGSNSKIGGIIGGGALLISGLLLALNGDEKNLNILNFIFFVCKSQFS
jgi:hypothetical protein